MQVKQDEKTFINVREIYFYKDDRYLTMVALPTGDDYVYIPSSGRRIRKD